VCVVHVHDVYCEEKGTMYVRDLGNILRSGPGHRTLAQNDTVVTLRECVVHGSATVGLCVRERWRVRSPPLQGSKGAPPTAPPAVSMSPSRVRLVVL
jgi:hypothetical protein